MTKRTLDDLNLDLSGSSSVRKVATESKHFITKKFKNSLDSDEEDDEIVAKERDILDPDDLEGQEDETIDRDGEIRITPFNMKDELEEGHFDKEGTFIFNKNEEIKDHWLDNIDWIKIKDMPKRKIDQSDSEDEETEPVDIVAHYKDMLTLMQPKETVLKAIKRLGGNNKSSASRWSKNPAPVSQYEIENREKLVRLTGLADRVLGTGDMDIYQQTFERLSFVVGQKTKDVTTDMFGEDEFQELPEGESESRLAATESIQSGANPVMWEFKWEDKEDAAIYGPHPSNEMLRWVEEEYFKDGVFVRKVSEGETAPFYTSNRIDFDHLKT